MTDKERFVLRAILREIDNDNFDEWFTSLFGEVRYGHPIRAFYIGELLVSRELIFAVDADPEFYRAALFPEMGGLQIETT